jgi:hypothetical protein
MDATTSIDDLRAALVFSNDPRDGRFLEALDEIRRRGAEAAPLVPELVTLLDDLRKEIVPNDRAPAEMDSDHDLIARCDLARDALRAIGAPAVAHLVQRYRSGERRAHFAGAIADMGEAGLGATLAILRDIEAVRHKLLLNLSHAPMRDKLERVRNLAHTVLLASKDCPELMLEIDRALAAT